MSYRDLCDDCHDPICICTGACKNDSTKHSPSSPDASGDSTRVDQTGAQALDTAIRIVLAERGSRYGDFTRQAEISQRLNACCREYRNFATMQPFQAEAISMILHKLSRILNGDPNYKDSWTDIAGYATLVADRCPEDK